MENITILGAGTMGHSIALSAAWANQTVNVYGIDEHDIANAVKGLNNKLKVMTENELFTSEQANEIRKRVQFTTSLEEAVAGATFIIEVIPEVLDLKKELYGKLEALVEDDVVIASNTSGFKPSVLAADMLHPARFVVTHFWNPAHLIPLVEVVKGVHTEAVTVQRAMDVLRLMNKKAIVLNKEIPGFIGNRLQYALFREAQALLDAGAAVIPPKNKNT